MSFASELCVVVLYQGDINSPVISCGNYCPQGTHISVFLLFLLGPPSFGFASGRECLRESKSSQKKLS